MFKPLHALAQRATLMIVITAEGPELLRVNITPVQPNDKTKAHELRPLSLLASPEELDTDFAGAVDIWQAPKRSLLDQARDAAGEDDESTGGAAAGKAKEPKAPPKKAVKPARGTPEQKSGDHTPVSNAGPESGTTVGDNAQAGEGTTTEGPAGAEPAGGAAGTEPGATLATGLAEAAAALTEIAPPAAPAAGTASTTEPGPGAQEAAADDTFTLDLF